MIRPEDLCMGCMEPRTGSICKNCTWIEGTPATSPAFLPARTVLDNRYLLGRTLGAGGFGITYLAWDLNLDFKLAIKEYFPSAFGARDRDQRTVVASHTQARGAFEHGLAKFLDEGRALARFQGHPSIASVMTFFRENGTSYLVMKFEDGITLQQYLRDHGGSLDFDTVMRLAMPIMDALRAVHQEGILHRDISPDNIIINRSRQIKILDFGSAKRDMTSQDATLQITLKRGYSPEEQYRAGGKQGAWTDVYAVAATIYHCLTGIKPSDALERLDRDTLQSPSQLGIRIPENCEDALLRALAVRGPNRFQTMEDFQKSFALLPVEPPTLSELFRRWLSSILTGPRAWLFRHGRLIAGSCGIAVALFAWVRVLSFLLVTPQINEFAAEPTVVAPGQAATLRWSVKRGRAAVSPDIGRITSDAGNRQVFPSKTTTYTITVRGPLRSFARSATITVADGPPTVAFNAEPPTIKPGETADLVWDVSGNPAGVTIDQGIGSVATRNRLRVSPTVSTTYTLRAKARGGEVSQASVTILILKPSSAPLIASMTARPPTIRKGERAVLAWQVVGDNAAAVFDHGIGAVGLRSSMEISPKVTTTYRLMARNPVGTVTRSVTVEVLDPEPAKPDPPKITAFSCTPENIRAGQSAALSWSVSGNVDSVRIEPGIGVVPAGGERRQVSPVSTTTYVISASGPGGSANTLECSVHVSIPPTPAPPPPPPTIVSFEARPMVVPRDQPVFLHWSVAGYVARVTLDPGKVAVRPEDTFRVVPRTSTRYTLTATGPGGSISKFIDIEVTTAPVEIVSFAGIPPKIRRGESTTLVWRVSGAVTDLFIQPGVGDVQGKSSINVTPDRTTEYVLNAKGVGKPAKSKVKITVTK